MVMRIGLIAFVVLSLGYKQTLVFASSSQHGDIEMNQKLSEETPLLSGTFSSRGGKVQPRGRSWIPCVVVTTTLAMLSGAAFSGIAWYSETQPQTPALPRDVESVNQQKWEDYKKEFKKFYPSLEEEERRKHHFLVNLAEIEKIAGRAQTVFGLTKFSDMSQDEFRNTYLQLRLEDEDKLPIDGSPDSQEDGIFLSLPKEWDWSQRGATTPVKNQGACGSCWAFAAVEARESAEYLVSGRLPELSAQQLVSCDKKNQGCEGGVITNAYEYMNENPILSESAYPYTSGINGSQGECKNILNASQNAAPLMAMNWKMAAYPCLTSSCADAQSLREGVLMAALVQHGPVTVRVNAELWFLYKKGVMEKEWSLRDYNITGYHLICRNDVHNHVVQLVGYGTTPEGVDYWKLRNSWGSDWGMDGYILLRRNENVCGIANFATYLKPTRDND